MFGFNDMLFNTVKHIEVDLSAHLSGSTSMSAQSNMEQSAAVHLSGQTSAVAEFVREIAFAVEMAGHTSMVADNARVRTFSAHMAGRTSINVEAGRFHIDIIEFSGQFKPGDRIVIDSRNMTMTINGQNALHMMQDDFFDLILGANKITYEDTATGREVLIRVTHRDKYV